MVTRPPSCDSYGAGFLGRGSGLGYRRSRDAFGEDRARRTVLPLDNHRHDMFAGPVLVELDLARLHDGIDQVKLGEGVAHFRRIVRPGRLDGGREHLDPAIGLARLFGHEGAIGLPVALRDLGELRAVLHVPGIEVPRRDADEAVDLVAQRLADRWPDKSSAAADYEDMGLGAAQGCQNKARICYVRDGKNDLRTRLLNLRDERARVRD